MPSMKTKKVAIIGPESTGKSELSEFLAKEFNTVWVPEYARTYLDNLRRPYQFADLTEIARGQIALEEALMEKANGVLICDTDLHVIKVWSAFKFGTCDPQILEWIAIRRYDLYLLTYIDLPWEPDPYREQPDKRDLLYEMYLEEMKSQRVPFVEIKGDRAERRSVAISTIRDLLDRGSEPA
jgi:NadR type nicotinamide-nucleotide adenylyltransferase